MALQVTGSFQLANGTYAVNPQILMCPNLPYRNILNLQAQVVLSGSVVVPSLVLNGYHVVDTLHYNNIDTVILPTSSLENPYSALIESLDQYVKTDLEIKQPTCTYNII